MAAAKRLEFEASIGSKLPFDDEVLGYLLVLVTVVDSEELRQLVRDFSPRWSEHLQYALCKNLLQEAKSLGLQTAVSSSPSRRGQGNFQQAHQAQRFTSPDEVSGLVSQPVSPDQFTVRRRLADQFSLEKSSFHQQIVSPEHAQITSVQHEQLHCPQLQQPQKFHQQCYEVKQFGTSEASSPMHASQQQQQDQHAALRGTPPRHLLVGNAAGHRNLVSTWPSTVPCDNLASDYQGNSQVFGNRSVDQMKPFLQESMLERSTVPCPEPHTTKALPPFDCLSSKTLQAVIENPKSQTKLSCDREMAPKSHTEQLKCQKGVCLAVPSLSASTFSQTPRLPRPHISTEASARQAGEVSDAFQIPCNTDGSDQSLTPGRLKQLRPPETILSRPVIVQTTDSEVKPLVGLTPKLGQPHFPQSSPVPRRSLVELLEKREHCCTPQSLRPLPKLGSCGAQFTLRELKHMDNSLQHETFKTQELPEHCNPWLPNREEATHAQEECASEAQPESELQFQSAYESQPYSPQLSKESNGPPRLMHYYHGQLAANKDSFKDFKQVDGHLQKAGKQKEPHQDTTNTQYHHHLRLDVQQQVKINATETSNTAKLTLQLPDRQQEQQQQFLLELQQQLLDLKNEIRAQGLLKASLPSSNHSDQAQQEHHEAELPESGKKHASDGIKEEGHSFGLLKLGSFELNDATIRVESISPAAPFSDDLEDSWPFTSHLGLRGPVVTKPQLDSKADNFELTLPESTVGNHIRPSLAIASNDHKDSSTFQKMLPKGTRDDIIEDRLGSSSMAAASAYQSNEVPISSNVSEEWYGGLDSHNGTSLQETFHQEQLSEEDDETPAASDERPFLIAKVFKYFDADNDGYLPQHELKPFAVCVGFRGSHEDWMREYTRLCAEVSADKSKGLTFALFTTFVDNRSPDGCYCPDSELRQMIADFEEIEDESETAGPGMEASNLQSPRQISVNHAANKTAAGYPVTIAAPHPIVHSIMSPPEHHLKQTTANVPPELQCAERSDLIKLLFEALDVDKNGCVNSQELRPFAEFMGFSGSDHQWDQEYADICSICQTANDMGLNLASFERLVDDTDSTGLFCPDEALQRCTARILQALEQPRNQEQLGGHSRRSLAAQLFGILDVNGDGILNKQEMRQFAEMMGFSGSDDDWSQEFRLLCQDASRFTGSSVESGLDLQRFESAVSDMSGSGCYCPDEQLRKFVSRLTSSSP